MYKEEISTALAEPEVKKEPIHANAFSSKTYPEAAEKIEPATAIEPKPRQASSIIEKPNYDFIEELSPEEEKKVYKIEKEQAKSKPNTFGKKLRAALFSLVVAVCGIWGIVNVVSITNLEAEIAAVNEVYQLNLVNYLSKLGTLDTASNYNDLFETYPVTPNPPSQVAQSSNWFDRFCNFIGGLFGG